MYATEPCTDSPLFDRPEVVVTPHLGASTVEAQDRAGTDVAKSVLLALAGEFVPDAVNVSGGAIGEEVSLWLNLTRKLAVLASAIQHGATTSVEVIARGELASENVDALGLAALRGVFAGTVDEKVTFVNAPAIAEDRGVQLSVTTAAESVLHRSVVEVRLVTNTGDIVSVVGALTGLDGVEKIVRINDRGLDLRAEGRNVFLHYKDRPGALGAVGSQLGERGINVEAAALSQDKAGTGATLVLRVDKSVPDDVMESMKASLDAQYAIALDFD